MRYLLLIAVIISCCGWTSWEDNPNNWKNSENNWNNSSNNWQNSPNNWANNQNNTNSGNGIYNDQGRTGYVTPKAGGGVNIYDNNGKRIGYQN